METQIAKVRSTSLDGIYKQKHLKYLASLLKGPPDVQMLMDELERFRSQGNDHFKRGQFKEAVERYSQCIKLGLPFSLLGTVAGNEIRRDILPAAASNRTQALLSLRLWEKALLSSEEALEFDPKHVKSLYRKAKALEALQDYKKACSILEYALELRSNSKDIKDALNQCQSFYQQSITGDYDLVQILCGGGYAPFFSDFVGPVEIRWTASSGRGLYLTRSVEPGEVLMVTNAFALGGSERRDKWENFASLTAELLRVCASSKRFLHQLHSLRGDDETNSTGAENIPPMELFIPGSDWSPGPSSGVEMPSTVEAYGKAKVNSFDALRSILPVTIGEGKVDVGLLELSNQMSVTGVWILPSFMNHSCAPNCSTQSMGRAMFVRAAETMPAGEELTISYIATEEVDREGKLSHWKFKCKCERCLQDVWVTPLIKDLLAEATELISTAESTPLPQDAFPTCCRLIARIEDAINNLSMELSEKQKAWIRLAFQKTYFYKLRFEAQLTRREKIFLLKSILEGYDSINMGIGGVNLQMPVSIMHAVEFEYGKSSEEYQEARGELERQFKKTLGNLKEAEIDELLQTRFTTNNLWYDMRR